MQRSLYRLAILTLAFSAAVGCAAESTPDPGPQVDPLNPQPLPPVTDDEKKGEGTDLGTGGGTSGSSTNSGASSSGTGGTSGTAGSSGGTSGSSGSSGSSGDAGGE